jgi:hypothetical protein
MKLGMLVLMALLAAIVAAAGGCTDARWNASVPTGTRITAGYFQFAEVFPERSDGGWRAVCIRARMGQRIAHPEGAHIDSGMTCALEVGIPISTRELGHIPLGTAQRIAADEANAAAYDVLGRSHGVNEIVCRQLIDELDRRLKNRVDRASADRCGSTAVSHLVPAVDWPGAAPALPSASERESQGTCETVHPEIDECWELPGEYTFASPGAALRAMKKDKGNPSLALHAGDDTESGPCPGRGTHYNVRAGATRVGSITCCPCCSDNPAGPAREKRCRIVW